MTTDTVGGVWNYSLELSRGMASRGVEVLLATMGQPLSETQRAETAEIGRLEVVESDYRLEWMEDPWRDVQRAGRWLRALELEHAPDVIHLNGYALGSFDFHAPRLVVAHSCVLSWWEAVKGEAAPREWERYRRHVRKGLHAADAVVAPTGSMLGAVKRHYGAPEHGRVIPNGRDPELFRPASKQKFIFAAGRLGDEAKNIQMLGVAACGLEWPVQVAGAECDASGQVPLPGNVQHCGRLSAAAVAERMARAPIYCLPARYEPFGLSILEAALAGCALVLGDIPSLRETWDGAALFVHPDDPAALHRLLRLLISEPELRQAYGRSARERAQRFTAERMVQGYLAVYREMLGAGVAAPAFATS